MCLVILYKKNQYFITLLLKMRIILLSTKVSVFQQDQINYHRKPSQRSYLAQTLIKTQKPHLTRGYTNYLLQNRKEIYWVVSQQVLLFKAF